MKKFHRTVSFIFVFSLIYLFIIPASINAQQKENLVPTIKAKQNIKLKQSFKNENAKNSIEGSVIIFDPLQYEKVIPTKENINESVEILKPQAQLGWQTIKSETFEGAFPNNWNVYVKSGGYADAYWGTTTYKKYQGISSCYCANDGSAGTSGGLFEYVDNMYAWMKFGPFNLSDAADAEAIFYHWTRTVAGNDRFYYGASINDTEYYVWHFTGDHTGDTGNENGWLSTNFDFKNVYLLGDLTGESQVWFAFAFLTDGGGNSETGTFIDNVTIRKEVSTGQVDYIKNFSDFPAYPYNTVAYKQGGAFVGCGPTTGAMILGYFDHVHSSTLLTNPVSGVNEGLNTAWALHASQYMNTQPDGFGNVYNIRPGLVNYSANRGYQIKATVHVSTTYNQQNAPQWIKDYGPYGDAWMNDGDFWIDLGGGNWNMDTDKLCDFLITKISSGTAIFLTVDSDGVNGGDHWVPCVGIDKANKKYYYYDTSHTDLKSAQVRYCSGPGMIYSISFVRSVSFEGGGTQTPTAPTNLIATAVSSSQINLTVLVIQDILMKRMQQLSLQGLLLQHLVI